MFRVLHATLYVTLLVGLLSVGRLASWSVGWLVGRSVAGLVSWAVSRFVGQLVD